MVILDLKNIDLCESINKTVEDVLARLNIDRIFFLNYWYKKVSIN